MRPNRAETLDAFEFTTGVKLLLPFRGAACRVEAPSEDGWLHSSFLWSYDAAGSLGPLDRLSNFRYESSQEKDGSADW
jgi:hypothetical protein